MFTIVALFLMVLAGCLLIKPEPASAAINLVPNPTMPASLENYLRNCDSGGQSPAFTQWLSAAGAPATTTLNVPYGAPSVNLDLHFAGAVCFSPSSTLETRLRVMSAVASVPGSTGGVVGRILGINFAPSHNTPGTFRHAATRFAYAPTGGFRTSGTYFIALDNRVINRFPGRYECVTPPSPV
ncbi:MAG: hypothetical protein ACRD4B_07160, partial [Acidobacteriota bacterium]